MSKKKVVQIIAVTFLLIAGALLIPNTKWSDTSAVWGFSSLIFGTLGSIISIFIPITYTYYFSYKEWNKNIDGTFSLEIKANKHGIGNSPQVQTFSKKESTYQKVGVSSHHDEKGNVLIIANSTFKGKVIIT